MNPSAHPLLDRKARATRSLSWRTSQRRSRNRRLNRGGRGVSDVVATILLLALTVVLFSSIFAFVTSFPSPPAQNTSQFSANLVLTKNLSYVQGIQLTHLAGPAIPGSSLVYFKSATHPQAPEFANPIAASVGLGGATTWNLGQIFNYSFPAAQQPILPDNITVLIVATDQLVFSTVLPGQTINIPPSFLTTSTSPATPVIGQAFTVYATALGSLGGASVYVNLANIPGLGGVYLTPQKMTYLSATNQWSFTVPNGLTTTNGTYFAFVNVTGSLGQTATAAVTVPIVVSGGSNGASLVSVAVVMTPQPPTLPATSAYFAAVVTYTGGASNVPLAVKFWANQTPGSSPAGKFPISTQTFGTASGLTISGPSTVTVYSSSPLTYSNWVFNSSVVVQASATLTGIASRNGTTAFTTANLVQGVVFSTKGLTTFAHSCTTTCPFLNVTVWDNWSTAVTFSGTVWANWTGNSKSFTIASTACPASSSVTISPPGVHTRWKPTAAGTYTLTVELVVQASGITVGYIFDTFGPIVVT
ncbi:MAG: type IV pilin N-terminal domain-containing protein [Thermoplasmata archaeon]|nr:type IV pilin N-terminal domain-containing protein [Thermoplasmata archaeon]